MSKVKKFSWVLIFCVLTFESIAQTQDSYEYNSEFTYGFNKNTFGGLIGGFVFKKGRKLSNKVLETYGLEIINVKHPQEVRRTSGSGNQFIYGKSNYLYALRMQYGRDIILFKKAPQQGAEIKAVFAAGPSLGIVAPYYVQIRGGGDMPVFKQYSTSIQMNEIDGSGRLFQGIGDSQIKVGLNVKAAINFELGTVKSQVTGFEAGFLLDAYSSKIEMMPAAKKYSVFPTLFLALFYGTRK